MVTRALYFKSKYFLLTQPFNNSNHPIKPPTARICRSLRKLAASPLAVTKKGGKVLAFLFAVHFVNPFPAQKIVLFVFSPHSSSISHIIVLEFLLNNIEIRPPPALNPLFVFDGNDSRIIFVLRDKVLRGLTIVTSWPISRYCYYVRREI